MTRAVHAEWTKLRTVPSTAWSVLSAVVATVTIGSFATLSLPEEGGGDVVRISLSGVYLGQVAIVILAVLAVTPEYDTTMIRSTLAALPRRARVLTAKAAVVTVIALLAGLLATIGSLISAQQILLTSPTLADGPTLRAHAGTVLYFGLIALLSIGVALITRHTGGTITAILSLLYTMPIIAALVSDPTWRTWILRLSPMTAGLAIQATRDLDTLPIAPWPGLALLTGYATTAVTIGGLLFHHRDA